MSGNKTIMRNYIPALLILAAIVAGMFYWHASQTPAIDTPALHCTIKLEDPLLNIEIRTTDLPPKVIKRMENVQPGAIQMSLSGVPDGNYHMYFSSPGYATDWEALDIKQGTIVPEHPKITLFQKRYVVLRYAFNTTGGRELSGKGVIEGRAAVAHMGGLPYFEEDWHIWQFNYTPHLCFHRMSKGFGFAKTPKGVVFDDLKEAPTETEYQCDGAMAEKGLTLFCRVEGNQREGIGYGKVLIEEVTEAPPAGIKLIEAGRAIAEQECPGQPATAPDSNPR